MPKRGEGPWLVPDGDVVLRASDVIKIVAGRDLRTVADEIGVNHTRLWRFLRENGYQQGRTWFKPATTDGEVSEHG